MVRRFSPFFLAVLALLVANPLSAAPPAKPQEQSRPLAAKAPARPVGVWVRDVGPVKVVLKLTDDRLTATALFATGEEVCPVVRVTLDADYAVAKDGTLFGVIFGADANHPMYTAIFEPFEGHAFAFSWRVDGDNLTVRNLKCLGEGMRTERVGELANLRMLVGGRYTRIDESKLPAWEKIFSDAGSMVISALIHAQLEEYRPKPPVPPPFPGRNEAPTAMPGVPSAMTAPPQPVVGVPPPPFVPTPQPLPAPASEVVVPTPPGPVGVPSGFTNGRDFTNPSPAPSLTTPDVPTSLVGTWTRDVGAFRATFKFTPKQLVVRMRVDPTGEKVFQELIFIVEHKLTTDGKRFEGTVIGADVKTGKGVSFLDANDTLRGAREVDGQPMQFEFRIAEGSLLVRDVRFGASGKSCELLALNLPGVYGPEAEKPAKAALVPASARAVERPGVKVEASGPVPVLPPLREGALPDAPPPPCIHEVLKALPPAPRGIPLVFEVSRENIEQTAWVVKELEADKLDPPRFYPRVGIARLHHATWKCTVTFSETIASDFPFPFKTTHERVEVVRVPQMSLYMYVGPEAPAVPPGEPTKVSNATGVVPASGTAPANPLHGTWVREQDGMQVVLKFAEKRLHVEINAAFAVPGEKGPPVRLTQSLDADYSTSPDGTVFGILTGIDVSLGEGLPPEAYTSVKEARREFEKMIGVMFKFRMRLDGGRMTLSEARASMFDSVRGPTGGVKSDTNGLVGELFGGRFERVNGTVPPPKPTAGGIINQYSEEPNARIEQLQKPEGEQRQKGTGLVPPPSTPAPKCKDCAPSLKLTPGVSEPVPPIPMSRG